MPSPPRPQLTRTSTWPTPIRLDTNGTSASQPDATSLSAAPTSKPTPHFFFDDLEEHPEDHFLSPMYEYEDWASDSDDGDEVEWDAGITDFALFDNERRRAQESREQLDSKWTPFMSRQQSALERAVHRSRSETSVDTTRPPLPMGADDVPALTPDSSPQLRDDLDVESFHGQHAPRVSVPSYLTVTLTPPSPEQQTFSDDEDLPLSFSLHRSRSARQRSRRMERPGLRHARTMSGKIHSWRKPSWNIYPLGEEPEAELRAERRMEEQT